MSHAPAFDPTVLAALNVPIKRLCVDSRRVRSGDIFAAAPGLRMSPRRRMWIGRQPLAGRKLPFGVNLLAAT